jgi:[ribosomal protein S18]-alanine N-acetyltransferase
LAELAAADATTGELLAALHGRVFADDWPAAAFAALLQIPGTLALVALDDGRPVGFVVARSVLDEAEIITIGVLPEHLRHGHALRLVDSVRNRMAAAGVKSLFLEVNATNTAARALYARLGFSVVGQRKGYYERPGQSPEDALVLRLTLTPSGRGSAPEDKGVGA